MQRRFRPTLPLISFALLGGLLSAAPILAADLPPATVPQGFGVNIHFTDPQPGEMDRFGEARFGVARMDFAWEAVEKTPGVYDFSAYDRLYATLATVGTRPLFILDYGNKLYDQGPPRKPEARAAFARFAAAAVRHFAGKPVIWEIWNEPNGDGFWPPKGNPSEYAAMALEAAKAIRAADPKCTLIAPGAAGFPWEYLETVFKSGLLQYLDGVSVHPYRGGAPESAAADWARLRGLIGRYAPADKRQMPMISSEWGYSTHEGGGVSEEKQGQYITREWLSNLASGVDLSIYYDWKEDGTDPRENEHHFGTVRPDYTPKPAFTNARTLIAALRGYTFRHRLQGKTDADWRLLFQRGDTGDLALVTWNASESASAADQTPAVRKLAAGDADYLPLLHLASIRFAPGPLALKGEDGLVLKVNSRNPDSDAASLWFTFIDDRSRSNSLGFDAINLAPNGSKFSEFRRFIQPEQSKEGYLYPYLMWNRVFLPLTVPVAVERTNPVFVSAAPWRKTLRVLVDDPYGGPLHGKLHLISFDRNNKFVETPDASIAVLAGATYAEATLPLPEVGTTYQVFLDRTETHATIGATERAGYIPLDFFPAPFVQTLRFQRTNFVENVPQIEKTPLSIIRTNTLYAPADASLDFSYHFNSGWQYAEITPDATIAASLAKMPAGASAFALWVRDDGSENALRARLRDATGQYFQPDLGQLNKKGWRLITIPLSRDGLSKEAHWGGANDGIPHYPLAWDSLLLVDSTHQTTPVSGEILLAAPYYVVQPAK